MVFDHIVVHFDLTTVNISDNMMLSSSIRPKKTTKQHHLHHRRHNHHHNSSLTTDDDCMTRQRHPETEQWLISEMPVTSSTRSNDVIVIEWRHHGCFSVPRRYLSRMTRRMRMQNRVCPNGRSSEYPPGSRIFDCTNNLRPQYPFTTRLSSSFAD